MESISHDFWCYCSYTSRCSQPFGSLSSNRAIVVTLAIGYVAGWENLHTVAQPQYSPQVTTVTFQLQCHKSQHCPSMQHPVHKEREKYKWVCLIVIWWFVQLHILTDCFPAGPPCPSTPHPPSDSGESSYYHCSLHSMLLWMEKKWTEGFLNANLIWVHLSTGSAPPPFFPRPLTVPVKHELSCKRNCFLNTCLRWC